MFTRITDMQTEIKTGKQNFKFHKYKESQEIAISTEIISQKTESA